MKRVIIRSVRNDRIIKIWQIEIRISASAKKPKLFISGRTQNPTEYYGAAGSSAIIRF